MPTHAGSQPPPIPNSIHALQEKVAQEGSLRVIVRLDLPVTADGLLSPQEASRQRQRIGSSQAALLNQVPNTGILSLWRSRFTPMLAMEVNDRGLQALVASQGWADIVEDVLRQTSLSESVPLIGGDGAHSQGFSGAGQTIAILDNGVDSTHSFLTGKVVSEACFSNSSPILGAQSACPNGLDSQIGPGSATPLSDEFFAHEHGTHVAGIAAGGNPGIGFSGVAKDATLIAIQVFTTLKQKSCRGKHCIGAFDSDIMEAMEHIYDLRDTFNIASINLSLGGGGFSSPCDEEPLKAQVDLLRSVEIATVAASGNEGSTNSLSSPACISTVISVGSTTKSDAISSFSNSADFLDLLAPGASILSSVLQSDSSDPEFDLLSGTSMATPHVAGAWAILKSFDPTLTVAQVLTLLKTSGIPVLDTRNNITKPRLNILLESDVFSNDVIIDFGPGFGLWVLLNNSDWVRLHTLSPEIMATGDFDGNGIDDVAVDFGAGIGTWAWMNNSIWKGLSAQSPEVMTTGDIDGNGIDDVVFDFGAGIGTWARMNNSDWNNSDWVRLHTLSPEIMATGDFDGNGIDDVAVDFGAGIGTWAWMNNSIWKGLSALSPEVMTTGDIDGNGIDDVVFDFGAGIGTWARMNNSDWNNSDWVKLHTLSPEIMATGDFDGNGIDDVAVDFGAGIGTWAWMNNSIWKGLSAQSPEVMTTGDIDGNGIDDVVFDFGAGIGTWARMNNSDWNNSDWVRLHTLSPEIMATGNIDGL